MGTLNIKPITKASLGATAFIGFMSVLFFGNGIVRVAESTAECMKDSGSVRECGHVEPKEFWEPIVILSGLGFLVGGMCFIYGRQEGEKALHEYLKMRNEPKP